MLPGDQFIYQQIGSWLANEPAVYTAYLKTASGSGVVGGLTMKAYWAALTSTRLYLIETSVGAFKPVYENKGVRTIERSAIAGVHVGRAQITIELTGGEQLAFANNRKVAQVSGQAHFIDELATRHGSGEVAANLGTKSKLKMIGGIAVAIIVVAISVYNQMHGGRAEVSVNCDVAGEELVCRAKHIGGGSDATVCWDVKLNCAEGKMAVAHTCADVDEGELTTVSLQDDDFRGFEGCEPPVRSELLNLEVKSR